MRERSLPFPRGKTANDGATLNSDLNIGGTPTTYLDDWLGNTFEVNDTVHNTGQPVTLRVLKAEANISLGTSHYAVPFGTTALDFGRTTSGVPSNTGAGRTALLIDDAYAANTTILSGDLFYAVEKGPVYGTFSANAAQGGTVMMDANGLVANCTAGSKVLGIADAAVNIAANTTGVIYATGIQGVDAAS